MPEGTGEEDDDGDSEVISVSASDDDDMPELLDAPDVEDKKSKLPACVPSGQKFTPLARNGNVAGSSEIVKDHSYESLNMLLKGVSGEAEDDLPENVYEDGERDCNGSTRIPFPAELRTARYKVVRSQRKGEPDVFSAQFRLAEVHYDSGRFGRACMAATMAFELTSQPSESAKAVRLAVRTYLERKNFQVALQIVEAQQQVAGAMKNPSARAHSSLAIADIYLATRRTKQALKVAEQALGNFRSAADKEGTASALQLAAKIELRICSEIPLATAIHAQKALRYLEEALGLLREEENKQEECDVLVSLSQAHLLRREYEDAHAFAKAASQLCEKISYAKGAIVALQQIAEIMFDAGEEPDMIVIIATQAVELAQHCGDWLGEISARQVVARAYVADGFKNSALEVLEPALSLARNLQNVSMIDQLLESMAKVHGTDSDLGLKLLYDEADLAKESGDVGREVAALCRVVAHQLVLGNRETALVTAEQAVQVSNSERVTNKKNKADALLMVARVHLAAKNVAQALQFADEAKRLWQDAEETMKAAAACQFKADIHEETASVDKMLESYSELGRVYAEAGWQDLEAFTQLSLAKRLSTTRGAKEALFPCKQAVALYRKNLDKEGEAMATLELAVQQFHAMSPPVEVLRTARNVRDLFRTLKDNSGEAQAMIVIADVCLSTESFTESMDASQEALRLAQEVDDKAVESKALQALARVHTLPIIVADDANIKTSQKAMDDALMSVAECIAFHQAMAEEASQAEAMLQLSSLHRINQHAEVAVQAAAQAELLARRLDDGRLQSLAFLRRAEAHLALGDVEEALADATDAQSMFAEHEDEHNYKIAIEIMDKAAAAGLKEGSGAKLAPVTEDSENEAREESEEMRKIMKGPFFAVGSWNDWSNFEELVPGSGDDEFNFSALINLRRGTKREEFQIVYNRDWTMRFHPAGGGKIEGPDNMHAINWQVLVPTDCVSLRITWNPRGAKSCQWRCVTANGEDEKVTGPTPGTKAPLPLAFLFQPGVVGFDYVGNKVTAVYGEQAARHGIKIGWFVVTVGERAFTTEALREAAGGKKPYQITFAKEAPPRAKGKLGVGMQGLLKDAKPAQPPLSFLAQPKPKLSAKSFASLRAPEELQRRHVAATGPLKSSISESDEAVGKIEAAEHRRAMLLGTLPPQSPPINTQFNSSLTESQETITDKEAAAELRRSNLLAPARTTAPAPEPLRPSWNEPDQEKRRAQLKAASAASQDSLEDVLKAVRSDWSVIERQAVVRKLSLIGVASTAELYAKLQEHSEAGVNSMLKDAGQRPLREDTLRAMHDHCRKTMAS